EGDVLTLPLGNSVRLVEIIALPERRGAPREARACYRELDPGG
ncbi:MAG TPA: RNA-binding protein, partial [Erythrobacter sp.]|nr:RNA-binding protein [Erythrobacter sp.]